MTCKLAKKPIGQNLAVFSYYTNERVKRDRTGQVHDIFLFLNFFTLVKITGFFGPEPAGCCIHELGEKSPLPV